MRCARCGTENPQGKIVCRRCGARLRANRQAPAPIVRETEQALMIRIRHDLVGVAFAFAVALAVGAALGLFVIR
ncbi:MAG: hypothetical protein QN163_09775 [Armatimonadota bacterium]|nr:hypothetical protein [Armatimonadota bacterium]MDR5697482.1 hypothetical protein [Armatimonadota bacterium]